MKWLSLKEALVYYRTSEPTMRRWLKAGKLEGRKVGRNWLVASDEKEVKVLTNAADPMFKSLFQNALKDFANDCADDCAYIAGDKDAPEIEYHPDKLEMLVNRYTDLLQKLLIWKGGEE